MADSPPPAPPSSLLSLSCYRSVRAKKRRNASKVGVLFIPVAVVCSLTRPSFLNSVLRGPRAEVGASNHGAGASRERAGHLPPGGHALPARLFPGQDGRWVLDWAFPQMKHWDAIEETHTAMSLLLPLNSSLNSILGNKKAWLHPHR